MEGEAARARRFPLGDQAVQMRLLGICPLLAVAVDGWLGLLAGLGFLITFVATAVLVSAGRGIVPYESRHVFYALIAATAAVLVDQFAGAYVALTERTHLYLLLIAANTLVMGASEEYAAKNAVVPVLIRCLWQGSAIAVTVVLFGAVRELMAGGALFGHELWHGYNLLIAAQPAGGFLLLGLTLAVVNWIQLLRRSSQ